MNMSKDRPVRLGVIGCGVIGQVHMEKAAQSPYLEPIAIADLKPEARDAAAAKFNIKKVYGDAADLLADSDVEAVVLAMPTNVRATLGPMVLKAGKHLLMEKPTAMNAGLIRELIDLKGKLTVACCSARNRCNDGAKLISQEIASGKLGQLRVVRYRATRPAGQAPANTPPVWRLRKDLNGGGILVNWGPYDWDFLLAMAGWKLKPKTVLAQSWQLSERLSARAAPGSDAETHITALVRCADGTVIQYERSEASAAADTSAAQFIGTDASLRMDNTIEATTKIDLDTADAQAGTSTQTIWTGKCEHGTGHLGVLEDFALAIREHRQPMTNLSQALMVQKITDAIYASAAKGSCVSIR